MPRRKRTQRRKFPFVLENTCDDQTRLLVLDYIKGLVRSSRSISRTNQTFGFRLRLRTGTWTGYYSARLAHHNASLRVPETVILFGRDIFDPWPKPSHIDREGGSIALWNGMRRLCFLNKGWICAPVGCIVPFHYPHFFKMYGSMWKRAELL